MPPNVTSRTTHSIAWRKAKELFGERAAERVGNTYPSTVGKAFGCGPLVAAGALQAIQQYAADPTPAHEQALAVAQTQVQAAHERAYVAYAGGPDFDGRAWVAMDVTNAFWCVLAALTGAPWPVTLAEAQVACRHVLERAQSLRA